MLALLLSLANEEQRNKFEQLYEQYKELVKYIALDVLKNDMNAEEVVQETFLRLFIKIDDIGDVRSFKTHGLVIIISRRISYNKLKYEKRRVHDPQSIIDNKSFDNKTAEDVAMDKIEQEHIFGELSRMNKSDFELITLRHYYGYNYEELEDFFDSSANTLRKRYQRGRERILKEFGDQRGEYIETAR